MLAADDFVRVLREDGIRLAIGVPDSVLTALIVALDRPDSGVGHVVAANEGAALAQAVGYHLATGEVPLVYLQNSGLGHALNPLLSLADPLVYAVPAVLLVGWRGEPGGRPDEPQHSAQGARTQALLDAAAVPWQVLPTDAEGARGALDWALSAARGRGGPTALLVRRATFAPAAARDDPSRTDHRPSREQALGAVLAALQAEAPEAVVVATTGKLGRELYELREATADGRGHARDFLTVGSMGHALAIAAGIAAAAPARLVVCLDGDGAALMHLGTMAAVGQSRQINLRQVVFHNAAHDSVGGHPTAAPGVDFAAVAGALGYPSAESAESLEDVGPAMVRLLGSAGPGLLQLRVRGGARANLGRPGSTPIANKEALMAELRRPGTPRQRPIGP